MGADLARARAGKKTRTGMSEAQLEDFASGPVKKKRRSWGVKGRPGLMEHKGGHR